MTTHLSPRDYVRKRPGMYVGPTDVQALYWIIRALTNAAIDQTHATACAISVTLGHGGACQFVYEGAFTDREALALMEMMTCDLMVPRNYATVPRNYADELTITNFLSEHATLDLYTGARHLRQRFAQGIALATAEACGATTRSGYALRFTLDATIFGVLDPSPQHIAQILRPLAGLTPGLRLTINDARHTIVEEICYPHGIRDYLRELTSQPLDAPLCFCSGTRGDIVAEVALCWTAAGTPLIHGYVNRHNTSEGSHVTSLQRALARLLDHYARTHQLFDSTLPPLHVRDLPPCAAIIAVQMSNPMYGNATRDILRSERAARCISAMLRAQLPAQLAAQHSTIAAWTAQRDDNVQRNKRTS